METIIRLALQKSGRLSEKSLQLLQRCGIDVRQPARKLMAPASNFPMEVFFLRDDDIPQYVEDGVVDLGMVGENIRLESGRRVQKIKNLGFAKCRLSLAILRGEKYTDISYFHGKKIATSYPRILQEYLDKRNQDLDAPLEVGIEEISGSVEIAPGIGLAQGIMDIVSTGSTLISNGLQEVETIMKSQAVLIAPENPLPPEKQELLDKFLLRIRAVMTAEEFKYILLNAPNDALDRISELLPGMKSPTVLPLRQEGWSSLHSVVRASDFWEIVDQLREAGAEGILVTPIENMVL